MAWISTPIENISDPLQQDMVKANSGARQSKLGWMIVGSSGSHSLHGNTGSELANYKINIIYSTEVFIYLFGVFPLQFYNMCVKQSFVLGRPFSHEYPSLLIMHLVIYISIFLHHLPNTYYICKEYKIIKKNCQKKYENILKIMSEVTQQLKKVKTTDCLQQAEDYVNLRQRLHRTIEKG